LQTTPIFPIYEKYQAKVVDFHGWSLPVQFSGIIQEHLTVRQKVGLFDVSHMGEFLVEGPDAPLFLDMVFTNRISNLKPGFVRYSPMCYENGGTLDDILIYRWTETKFLLVSNASNTAKVGEWLTQKIHRIGNDFEVSITDISLSTAQLAIQGPRAADVLEKIVSAPEQIHLKYYQFYDQVILAGIPVLLSRTGYTGEDGFEMYVSAPRGPALWDILMDAGSDFGIQPIGLGARDTLRFEAGLPLYGNELGLDITPIEANLNRFIDFSKEAFIGKTALLEQYKSAGYRHLVGLEMIDRGVPRSGYRIFKDNQPAGYVTSGNYSPSLQKNLALALINHPVAVLNETVHIEIRDKILAAKVIPFPFYTRNRTYSKS
jgi:aminomethyltransferase